MSKQREALRIALDALEDYQKNGAPFFKCDSAVAAIRDALAEPQKTNQCGETCERAKLCAICASGVSNNEPLTEQEDVIIKNMVSECIIALQTLYISHNPTDMFYSMRAIDLIKEHFGVNVNE